VPPGPGAEAGATRCSASPSQPEQRALDITERAVDAGSAVAHAAASSPVGRVVLAPAQRIVEPVEARGRAARTEAVANARVVGPEYASRVVDTALDVVSIDEVLQHVDLNALLARIDIGALLESVDLNEVMEHIDLESLVERTEIGAIIAKSTGGVASEMLDLVRRQGVGLDGFLFRWAKRIRRRGLADAPDGPPLLMQARAERLAQEAPA
jgi:hypothetical protein